MPVIVKSEFERLGVTTLDKDDMELCCFCRTPTEFWTEIESRPADHVACCESCASRAWEEDVPSKSVWIRRERIATLPTFRDIQDGRGPRAPKPDEVATYVMRKEKPKPKVNIFQVSSTSK